MDKLVYVFVRYKEGMWSPEPPALIEVCHVDGLCQIQRVDMQLYLDSRNGLINNADGNWCISEIQLIKLK